jgi:hypothetical protein
VIISAHVSFSERIPRAFLRQRARVSTRKGDFSQVDDRGVARKKRISP